MTILMYLLAAIGIAVVVYMLIKKLDIKITLFVVGMLLGVAALLMKKVPFEGASSVFYPFKMIVDQFKRQLPAAGLIILMLGGYTAYMSHIGANDVTVDTLTKPLKNIKSVYILVPIVFLIGNLLSLVIPSASNLAVILLATLYPVLRKSGMSKLTAAAVIATTATVMPTPLGGDNIVIAGLLKEWLGVDFTPGDYVFKYHALVSVPTLFVMAITHYFWQKYMDKKAETLGTADIELAKDEEELEVESVEIEGGILYRTIYTLLPLMPIILLLLTYAINFFIKDVSNHIQLSVEIATIISFIIAIVAELIAKRAREANLKTTLADTETFFRGMGGAIGIVVLLVAAGVFVDGLKAIGIIDHLQLTMQNANFPGFVLPLILVLFSAVIVIISGSGLALFYAMAPLMIPLAVAAKISPLAVTIPMGLAGNLLRAVSPVSAVVMIVAGTTKENPVDIVKRTAMPMIIGTVFMFVLSMLLFLTGIVSLPS